MEFKDSQTKINLMRAFAGESQARNRYTFAAQEAKKQKLHIIEQVLIFTANQEKEHAEIFYKHLKEFNGETIFADGGYPVDCQFNVAELLRAAQHNEYQEHDDVYKNFSETAKAEGFIKVAATFHMIGEIEKTHGDRLGKLAAMIEDNKLFVSKVERQWVCLNCGYVHTGTEAPYACPVCDHDQGYFILAENDSNIC